MKHTYLCNECKTEITFYYDDLKIHICNRCGGETICIDDIIEENRITKLKEELKKYEY